MGVSVLDFLLIGESKLKIVMSAEELKYYGIETFVGGNVTRDGRRRFWEILNQARDRVGFDPARDKVLVQFYPAKSGECEIFVTKLGLLAPASAKLVSRSDKVTLLSRSESVYHFSGFEALVGAARVASISSDGADIPCDIYRLGESDYYLIIEEYGKGDESAEFHHLLEFGTRLTADMALYLKEHAEHISALGSLKSLCELPQ